MKASTVFQLATRRIARAAEPLGFGLMGRPDPASAVVVASSGRSGSTWLADMLSLMLRLQQVFEPLHPKHSAEVRRLTGFESEAARSISYYLRASDPNPDWDRFLEAVLVGKHRSRWTDAVPTIWFPQGYLVKMIRANLMLGHISDRFRPRIVYLVRHPCAVVHSRLTMGWTVDARSLLKQDRLVEDYLQPWVSLVEREKDVVGSHALWWAVENLVAQRELSTRLHYRIFYEHLITDPVQETKGMAEYVGLHGREMPQTLFERSSRTSHRVETNASVARLVSWKDHLSKEDQFRILDWAIRLSIPWYDSEPWPRGASGPGPSPHDKAGFD